MRRRARFPLEVAEAVIDVWGGERVGYKIAPYFLTFSMSDSDPVKTYTYLARELRALQLGYLSVTEFLSGPAAPPAGAVRLTPMLRKEFGATLIVNGGYDAASGDQAITSGRADLVAYGHLFLANPDLPERFRKGAPLNQPDSSTFYAGEEKGYIDYPKLGE